jgi:hypothetical protein
LWSWVWCARERLRNEFNTSGAVCAFTTPSARVETHYWPPCRVFLCVRSAPRRGRSYMLHENRLPINVKVSFWNVKCYKIVRPWHLTTYKFKGVVKSQCARVQKHLCGARHLGISMESGLTVYKPPCGRGISALSDT